MPRVSLVVCLHNERDLFARLLKEVKGCYDDLVVIHDGPEEIVDGTSIQQLVQQQGEKFVVAPRAFQQEPHWPSAWKQAKHDWILRLDADEVPSAELKNWLQSFRAAAEPPAEISGYTCIWPLWNGTSIVTKTWPAGRIFLLNRNRVRFFGMPEQVPVPENHFEPLALVLEHRPTRKSYGLANLLLRAQAYRWRRIIARALLGKPTDLPCWRWTDETWPEVWEEIRRSPIRTAFYRLFLWPVRSLRDYWRKEQRVLIGAALSGGINHFLIAIEHWFRRYFSGAA